MDRLEHTPKPGISHMAATSSCRDGGAMAASSREDAQQLHTYTLSYSMQGVKVDANDPANASFGVLRDLEESPGSNALPKRCFAHAEVLLQ